MPPHVFPSEYLLSGCFGELLTADDSFSFFVGHVTATESDHAQHAMPVRLE